LARTAQQLIEQLPELPALAEAQAQFCARYPGHRDCRGDSLFGQVFEVIPQEALMGLFPLVSFPGILPKSGVESATREFADLVGIPQEGVTATIRAGQVALGTGLLNQGVGGVAMPFEDFFGGFVDEFSIDPFSEFFSDISAGQLLDVAAPIVGQYLVPNQGLPAIGGRPILVGNQPQQQLPAPRQSTVPTQAVSRSMFNRFPAIATAIQSLKNAGIMMTANSLFGRLATFGVPAVVGFLASYVGEQTAKMAVTELALRGKKHRRMNSCNAKALRRALRRVRSFQRLKTSCAPHYQPRRKRCA
jgi:hypothetical protein